MVLLQIAMAVFDPMNYTRGKSREQGMNQSHTHCYNNKVPLSDLVMHILITIRNWYFWPWLMRPLEPAVPDRLFAGSAAPMLEDVALALTAPPPLVEWCLHHGWGPCHRPALATVIIDPGVAAPTSLHWRACSTKPRLLHCRLRPLWLLRWTATPSPTSPHQQGPPPSSTAPSSAAS